MQKLISQIPQLKSFLQKVPKTQHHIAIKQIIKLGLQSLHNQQDIKQNKNPNILVQQIDRIKQNIKELNHMFKRQCQCYCNCQQNVQKIHNTNQQDQINKTFSFKPKNQQNRRINFHAENNNELNFNNKQTLKPFSKYKHLFSKHHLDDTEVRLALNFPKQLLSQMHHPSKRRSQQYKKHIYQQQINKEQQVKLKQNKQDIQQGRTTRAITDYKKTTSKIKSLLDKDRIRFMQRQKQESFSQGFKKYQYSEQNQMEQSSSIHQQPQRDSKQSNRPNYQEHTYNQQYHSSFQVSNEPNSLQSNQPSSSKKNSSKKQFQQTKKEVSSKLEASGQNSKNNSLEGKFRLRASERASDKYNFEEESDEMVSNSSSFSQFSISGSQKRDIGKISRKINT